jgi:hypothetical protein
MEWVYWCISGEQYGDQSVFEREVTVHNAERDRSQWRPDEVVLRVPMVFVTTNVHWHLRRRNPSVEPPMLELVADDGKAFTARELLFKIHNGLLDELREMDHKYFEGLTLVGRAPGDPPVYEVNLGS